LWAHLSKARRGQFKGLVALMIAASAVELVSISSVIPFLSVLTAPENVYRHRWAAPVVQAFGLQNPRDLLVPATLIFAAVVLLACAIRLLLVWIGTRLSFATGSDIGIEIYRRMLYQPYSVHVSRNTSEIIDAVTAKTHAVINGVLYPLVNLTASLLIVTIVFLALLTYRPEIALLVFVSASVIYLILFRVTRSRLTANSEHIAYQSTKRIRALQEGLGGIRDLLLGGTQDTYCDIYKEADRKLRRAQAENAIIGASPRYLVEALAMCVIAALGFSLALRPGGVATAIPLLGGMALGAQRMLPMLQQIYQGWTSIKGSQKSLTDVISLLELQVPSDSQIPAPAPLPFACDVRFENICFRYVPTGPWILEGINLSIPRGSRIGLVGTTGAGKSTLIDVLTGLLQATAGRLLVDGVPITGTNQRAWQRHIAYVPQSIFLADATIEENIAFGFPVAEIDRARVYRVAEQAQIAATIDAWPLKYRTVVGERGVRISGGQRQRIGIARALYRQSDVIVLDEATSALDNVTEDAVMTSIQKLDRTLTIIVIAHRISTLKACDVVVELVGGRLAAVGRGELAVESGCRT
jgi:ATP-binding cassette subfamily B protein